MVADVMRVAAVVLALVATGAACAAGSEADPTLPPAVVDSKQAAQGGKPETAVLESVLIPAKGRPLAIIGGQRVMLGEKFGEDKLVKITENEVVLRGKEGETHLFLNPAVHLKPIARRSAATRGATSSGGRSQP